MNMDFIPRMLARPPRLQSLAGFASDGAPLLQVGTGAPQPALVLGGVGARELRDAHAAGGQVLVIEADGRAVVVGVVHAVPQDEPADAAGGAGRVVIAARDELVLRSGDASITLTSAGKVMLRGAYVSTHAEGENRIKGGSVRIN